MRTALLACFAVSLLGCKAIPSAPPMSLPVNGSAFDAYTLQEIIGDRTAAPNITSMRNNPVVALGTLYVRRAKPAKLCSDTDPAAFIYERLISLRADQCEVDSNPASDQLINKKVKGGAAMSFKALIGSAAADTEAAFEFFVTEPTSAYFKDSGKCYDGEKIRHLTLPSRTCEVYWIAGAVLTQISTRSYKQVKGNAEAAFAVLKLDGSAYYNTSDAMTRYLMTVDPIVVSQEYARKDGFLEKAEPGTRAEPKGLVPAMPGKNVPPLPEPERRLHLEQYDFEPKSM